MYTLYGALGSPYSMKLRAIMRYRRITHIWTHGAISQQTASQLRAPVIPVLQFPDGTIANDTTPLIYTLEERHPERSIVPDDPGMAFLAHLIEDYADEWVTKAMFGYRWLEEVDQKQMSRWLAVDAMKGGTLAKIMEFSDYFTERQVGRMALVGCTRENFPLIEASTRRLLQALEDHVVNEQWLLGSQPSMAEFSLYGQLSQLGTDPTAQEMMRADYPFAFRWLAHVDDASGIEGEWDAPDADLKPVTKTILAEVGRCYVPFLLANAAAAEAGEETFRMEVDGMPYEQGVFKYQLKCLADLRTRYAGLSAEAKASVDPELAEAGCLEFLS
ncbi:MAG: glutathione S-transferase N-terminal domain-containing protein [Pseudomonadota bacterium]